MGRCVVVEGALLVAEVASLPVVVALPEEHPGAEAEAVEGSVAEEAEEASAVLVRIQVDSRPGLGLEAVGEVDIRMLNYGVGRRSGAKDRAIRGLHWDNTHPAALAVQRCISKTILPRFCAYLT